MNDTSQQYPCNAEQDRHSAEHAKGLTPLVSLDISAIHSFDDMLKSMSLTAFGGRQVGEAADLLTTMAEDPDCFVVGTFSGAMTVGKQGLLITEMIDRGMLNAIVSTGALMTHGLVEGVGMSHFKFDPVIMNDKEFFDKGFNRVTDTIELEKNLDDLEDIVDKVFEGIDENEIACSSSIVRAIGKHLSDTVPGRAIVKSAYEKNVPIYIPAFTDSELGLDFALYNRIRQRKGKKPIQFNPFLDLEHYTELIIRQKRTGIFTIGGGVPRNWAQQVACYLEIMNHRQQGGPDGKEYPVMRFMYGLRICPEPVHWGGLSGCTYSEGVSWGKFVPPEEGGKFVEVLADATTVWPLLLKGVTERLDKKTLA